MKRPNVCDIKLGRQSYEPNATPEKKSTEIFKYKWRNEIGFLITGILINTPHSSEPVYFSKSFGQNLDRETILTEGLHRFLGDSKEMRQRMAFSFLEQLKPLVSWFEKQTELRFYGSSIVLAFDSSHTYTSMQSSPDEGVSNESFCKKPNSELLQPFSVVRLIDFAHWSFDQMGTLDENCLYGLRSLQNYLLAIITNKELTEVSKSPDLKRSHSIDSCSSGQRSDTINAELSIPS
ncbi:hypothetical protein Ciccas_001358 [Cichlidogyrus casuarinus]|uniref:Kinase n=1 Tax=Cichlidogyrus casuarinus TaxID=1844966 RepID=A0ABD2QKA3_9PLAT